MKGFELVGQIAMRNYQSNKSMKDMVSSWTLVDSFPKP